MVLASQIRDYLHHLDSRILFDQGNVREAFEATYADLNYHYPGVSGEEAADKIRFNNSELAIFLYRLGRIHHLVGDDLQQRVLHGLMRSQCSCELYFSNQIGTGLHIVHSVGIVIGSRNTIGDGFVIYQNTTIGHDSDEEQGAEIGDRVSMLPA